MQFLQQDIKTSLEVKMLKCTHTHTITVSVMVINHFISPISHRSPVNPAGHLQLKDLTPSTQLPPLPLRKWMFSCESFISSRNKTSIAPLKGGHQKLLREGGRWRWRWRGGSKSHIAFKRQTRSQIGISKGVGWVGRGVKV